MNVSEIFHRVAASTEDAVDIARRRIWQRTGRHRPRQIAAYQGYANPNSVLITGRVLANKPGGGPLDDDGWWENLVNTYRRWESDEVPFEKVTVRFGDREITTETDEEGYYRVEFPATGIHGDSLEWYTAAVRAGKGAEEVHAVHDVMVPPRQAEFGIISDLDDTVIHTGITSILLAAKLTFLENAKTRKPLDGVAELYKAFQSGNRSLPTNPMFYVSSSPWNLHDLLEDFLKLNDIPPGPMLLRDVGIDRTKFIKEKGHGHKQRKAMRLLEEFPDLPFILVGDSGQEDPEIYAAVVERFPGRVRAIYIRDVDPDMDSELDRKAKESASRTEAFGVPMIFASDSRIISDHARDLGLIAAEAVQEIVLETVKDQGRPDTASEAISDIV